MVPGGGLGTSGGYPPVAPRNDPYANVSPLANSRVNTYNNNGQFTAPVAAPVPRASDYINSLSVNNLTRQYGLDMTHPYVQSVGRRQ